MMQKKNMKVLLVDDLGTKNADVKSLEMLRMLLMMILLDCAIANTLYSIHIHPSFSEYDATRFLQWHDSSS